MQSPVILAIESSCDETSASIAVGGNVMSNVIASQEVHAAYGGVVPELASRAHMENIIPVVEKSLAVANESLEIKLSWQSIDAIAFTEAPGLIGSLLVGAQFAKSLALAWNKPLIAVHHMQAHVLANLLQDPAPDFPFLCLTVSGGHTQLVLAHTPLHLEVIGETIDDAAGEAFDKAAKMLGLPYPGGPLIDRYAADGNPKAFQFAQPQVPGLNFSFSGLKTSVLYFIRDHQANDPNFLENNMADICASLQHAIVSVLMRQLKKAVKETGIQRVCLAGGVSANRGLRAALLETGKKLKWQTFVPPFDYCTDNAGMIAITAHHKFLAKEFVGLNACPSARAGW